MWALKGSISVRRYSLIDKLPDDARRKLMRGVRAHAFIAIDPQSDVERSAGWVSMLDGEDADLHPDKLFFVAAGGEQVRLALRIDVLKPSSAEVRRQLNTRVLAVEAAQGRALSKREKGELKTEIARVLRLRTLPRVRVFDVVWNLDTGRLYFWSQADKVNESFLDAFAKSFALRLEIEGPARWAADGAGARVLDKLLPTPELWHGFPGVRPLPGAVTEDE